LPANSAAIAALNRIHSKIQLITNSKNRWLRMKEAENTQSNSARGSTNKIEINDDDEADHPKGLLRPDWRKRGETPWASN
jgi:hypothetical protein